MKKYIKQILLTVAIAFLLNQILHIIDPQGSYNFYTYLFTGALSATAVFFLFDRNK